ncbi:MAG: hypothetical protein GWN64_07970 [Candidatus Thorarchaeota archaeon]|nr:hypothetical protein [Candidatus Thorarchaeota archaeon]
MAVDAGSIKSEVRLQLAQLRKDVSRVETNMQRITKSASDSAKKSSKSFLSLASVLKTALFFGAIALVRKGFRAMKEAITVQIKAEQQLEARLKSTGQAAGLTFKELTKMASGLQKVTTFGDEAIIGAQNILLTFTKIGKDVFPNATETVLNMATAFGTDLKAASIQLGKALQDPIQGVTALRRVGVQLSDEQTEQIKNFVELNDIASAQKIILSELETQVGGAARASAEGIGRFEQFGNAIGDLGERIATKFLPPFIKFAEFGLRLLGDNEDLTESTESLTATYEEWQKAIKATTGDLSGLSEEQKALNELQAANAELKFFEQLEEINDGYRKQQKEIANTREETRELTVFLEGLRTQENKTAKDRKLIAEFELEIAKNKATLRKQNEELEQSITNLAIAEINLDDVNVKSLVSNQALAKAIAERVKQIKDGTFELKKQKDESGDDEPPPVLEYTEQQIQLLDQLKEKLVDIDATEEELALIKIERERLKAEEIARGNAEAEAQVEAYYNKLRDKTAYEQNMAYEEELAERRIELKEYETDAIKSIAQDSADLLVNITKEGTKAERAARIASFLVAKGIRISELITSGIARAQQAYAASIAAYPYPPGLGQARGVALKRLIGISTGIAVAKVATERPRFQFGGIVPGGPSQGVDSVDVRATPGEAIITPEQQAELFKLANGGGGATGQILQIVAESGEVLREYIFENTKNGLQKIHANGLVALEERI